MRGQAFQFWYRAAALDVVWSERPEQVPAWDWTRWNPKGGGLNAFGDYTANGVPWPETSVRYVSSRALPTPAMEYPRLVRAHPGQQFEAEAPEKYRVFLALWPLLQQDPSGQSAAFQQGVVAAVPQIGLLDPHGTGDTLAAWCSAVLTVAFWTWFLGELKALGKVFGAGNVNDKFWNVLSQEWGVRFMSREDVEGDKRAEGWLAQGGQTTRELTKEGFKALGVDGLIQVARGAVRQQEHPSVQEACATVARILTRQFTRLVPRRLEKVVVDGEMGLPSNTMIVSVGALAWALYELAELYATSDTAICPACGKLFVPPRKDKQFCSRPCLERVKKRRQRSQRP